MAPTTSNDPTAPATGAGPTLLQITNLAGGYGGAPVLHGLNFGVQAGRVTALLGRNGMGKTSTIKAIMGLLPQATGSIQFDGSELTQLPSYKRARLGIGFVPESRQVFPSLSVREHLTVAARKGAQPSWSVERLMDTFPVLGKRANSSGVHLSGGEQQLLVIARALSLNPRLLLLDEPTEGLSPAIVGEIRQMITQIVAEPDPPAVLVVEQNLRFALRVADEAIVLVLGEIAYVSSAEELGQRRDIQQELIGLGAG